MSVRPTAFGPDERVTIWHDEFQHGGSVPLADVKQTKNADGSPNPFWLELVCPATRVNARGQTVPCGSVSLHPVGGGADPVMVQRLFVRAIRATRGGTFREAKVVARNLIETVGELHRWRLDDASDDDR